MLLFKGGKNIRGNLKTVTNLRILQFDEFFNLLDYDIWI